jgi:anti-sigma regulatory factor (Ser/Thr protein kinase)
MIHEGKGMNLLSKIKAEEKIKNIPVIMQTNDIAKEDMLDGLNAGAYYYVSKPYNEKILVSIVTTAIKDYQYYNQLKSINSKTTEPLCMMKKGEFRFRSLNEGRNLAAILSNACPNSDEVVLGLTELMINAVEHGNLGIGYDEKTRLNANNEWEKEVSRRLNLPPNKDKYVSIEFSRNANEIKFLIADQGRGFDWEQYMEISPKRIFDSHGRGIAIANLVSFDQLEYLETGNKVSVTVSLH